MLRPAARREQSELTEVYLVSQGTLNLARAVVGVIGAGALVMAISGLTSGNSLTDPVFPAGLALGALAVGATAWVVTPGLLPAIVTWLGLLGEEARRYQPIQTRRLRKTALFDRFFRFEPVLTDNHVRTLH